MDGKKAFKCQSNRLLSYFRTTKFRKPIPVKMQVAVTMYYVSDEGGFRKTVNALGIAKNTVSMINQRVTKAISNHLADKCIKLPQTEEEVNEFCILFFGKYGFPQCLGGVGGHTSR